MKSVYNGTFDTDAFTAEIECNFTNTYVHQFQNKRKKNSNSATYIIHRTNNITNGE